MDLESQEPNFDPAGFWTSEPYLTLTGLGNALWPAVQYGNYYVVDDVYSQSLLRLGLAGYYQGLVPCIQLEEAVYFLKALNLEYPYCLMVRTYMEHVGRCHKAVAVWKRYGQDRDGAALALGALRLTAPRKTEGYNVMTLVDSLQDVISDAREQYDRLSDYSHGDFTWHATIRRESYLVGTWGKVSPAITTAEQRMNSLRDVLIADAGWLGVQLEPFAKRVREKWATAANDPDGPTVNPT